jgi:hypothetical protein
MRWDIVTELKSYPVWVCRLCASKGSSNRGKWSLVATYHADQCGVCGEMKAVTEPRDFGYPKFKGHEKP